jgi:hypothetical protein
VAAEFEQNPDWRARIRQARKSVVIFPPNFTPQNSFLVLDGSGIIRTESPNNVIKLSDRNSSKRNHQELKTFFKHVANIGLITIALEASVMGVKLGMMSYENNSAWNNAETIPNISGLEMGGSLSLENYGLTEQNYISPLGKVRYDQAMNDVKDLYENEKMRSFRIELQWRNIVDENGKFNFGMERKLLNYLLNQDDTEVTLNLPDIKTFRWPEQNVPDENVVYLKEVQVKGGVVHTDDKIAKLAVEAESAALKDLQDNYTDKQLLHIKTIQFNNESKKLFGDNAVTIGDDVNIKSVKNVMENFPKFANVQFLFNSAGYFNIESTKELFGKLRALYPNIKLTMGIDYYGIDVGNYKLPLLGEVNPENIPIFGNVDPRFYDEFLGNEFLKAKNDATKLNYKMEITELQAEPWDGNPKLPGNIVKDFNYEVNRAAGILPESKADNTKLMRVWGLEYLMQHKNDPEVKQILTEIKEINAKNQSEKAVSRNIILLFDSKQEDLALAA